jgi:hypothetical protein
MIAKLIGLPFPIRHRFRPSRRRGFFGAGASARRVQRSFAFVDRHRRLECWFKAGIVLGTVTLVSLIFAASSSGRNLASWLVTRTRWAVQESVGLAPNREEIDADWRRRRLFDVEQTRGKLRSTYEQYEAPMRKLLDYAGLDPDHALLRWGNFDRTLYLPSTVFEPDESGRSYRFRPGVRSIWVRNLKLKGGILGYFQVPDGPGLAKAVEGTGALIVESSVQTTNSWGLRGPEPDTSASLRGIILGDSYMQGLFVGDDETPSEYLKKYLSQHEQTSIEILNTGHLGYSPEQEYYTLREYADRFRPHFVVLSLFANDFGDLFKVLEGEGDFDEGKYWLGQIAQFCRSRQLLLLAVPAPWVNQLEGERKAGNYPGRISNFFELSSAYYLDPIEAFTDEYLRLWTDRTRKGLPTSPNPLFHGQLGDGHFSVPGCELWARTVGERLRLLLDKAKIERQKAR